MDQRTKMLATSIGKLMRRGAEGNIRRIINKTHDADVASVLESLDTSGRISVFQLIPDAERQASILSHIGKNSQIEIAHVLEIGKLQKLLSMMDSDDAADLLGHLPDELSQQVLSGLNKDDLQEVEELLSYPDDSAGGLMSSEFLTINESLTVRETIEKIQAMNEDLISFYIYVVNDTSRLVGVLSLKQLLLSRPQEVLREIMSTDVISASLSTNQNEVAQIVEKYDFLSLPVVDENHQLVGVITVDDVIDVIREKAVEDIQAMGMGGADVGESYWAHIRARLPWLLFSFGGGLVCHFLLWTMLAPLGLDSLLLNSICIMPLVFFMVSTLSSQTVTTLVNLIRAHATSTPRSWLDLKKEFAINASFTLLFTILFAGFGIVVNGFVLIPLDLSLVFVLQLFGTFLVSMGLPLFIRRLNFDPIVLAPSVTMIVANVIAVATMVLYYAFR